MAVVLILVQTKQMINIRKQSNIKTQNKNYKNTVYTSTQITKYPHTYTPTYHRTSSNNHSTRYTPKERESLRKTRHPFVGEWMGPRVRLDWWLKITQHRYSIHGPSSSWRVATLTTSFRLTLFCQYFVLVRVFNVQRAFKLCSGGK
jgi:hypothetical protein